MEVQKRNARVGTFLRETLSTWEWMDSHAKVALAVLKWKLLRDHVAFIGAIVTAAYKPTARALK